MFSKVYVTLLIEHTKMIYSPLGSRSECCGWKVRESLMAINTPLFFSGEGGLVNMQEMFVGAFGWCYGGEVCILYTNNIRIVSLGGLPERLALNRVVETVCIY